MSKICSIETTKMIYYAHIYLHRSFGVVLCGETGIANFNSIFYVLETIMAVIICSSKETFENYDFRPKEIFL